MPRRLFCVHTTCSSGNANKRFGVPPQVDWMLSLETDPSGSRVSAFEFGMKTSLSGRHHLVDLNDFDMVFVPVLEVDHYYLVVFDLEEERINLIAHLGDKGSGGLFEGQRIIYPEDNPI
ncbi:hypothetical protein Hanom_Chr10g00897231 [Helianthus anomalus]